MKTLLLIVKSIDGGTGKYIENLQGFNFGYLTKTLVLEKPIFRKPYKDYIVLKSTSFEKLEYFNFFNNIRYFVRNLYAVGVQINRIHPDIVLSVDVYANIIALMCKIIVKMKYKVIITTHNYLSMVIIQKTSFFQRYLIKFCVSFFYGFADKIVAVSHGVKDDLIQYFGIRKSIEVIYNGTINQKNIANIREKKYNGVVVSVGRLVEQKDFRTLLLAFSETHKIIPSLRLWIVGDGPLKNTLIRLSEELNIKEKVTFFGWRQNVGAILEQADIFIMSTKWEGFPYVLIEAMSYGLPIIATASPHGVKELLDNGKYGKLVGMGDIHKMSQELIRLSRNEKNRDILSHKSRRRYEYFTLEKMYKRYYSILHSLF